MTPVTPTSIDPLKRQYPHVGEVSDWPSAQSLRLLWERIFALQEALTAAQATITSLVAASNTNETTITTAQRTADQALALAQRPAAEGGTAVGGSPGGGGGGEELPGGGDGGQGAAGCAGAGATGHDTGGPLNAVRAGQLVCGTGNEFSALKNPVATSAERQANLEELLRRMIWHLQQGGFEAGRQQNPSGAISQDKLTVIVDGVLRAYDVFSGGPPSDPVDTHMNEVGPPVMVSDAGIPD